MILKSSRRYIDFLFQTIKKYLACLIPRSSSIYVFGSWFGEKYSDNSKYFFEYMSLNHPEITSVWISKSQEVVDAVRKLGFNAHLESSTEGKQYMKKAKYVFVSTGWRDIDENLIGGATVINFWHGVPLKKIMYDDQIYNTLNIRGNIAYYLNKFPQRNEFVVSTSETLSNIYINAFRRDKRHIVLIGQPRNDVFYSGSFGSLRERFPNKKIVTYLPTHRKQGSVTFDCNSILNLEMIDQLCMDNNCVFIIKKHFYHAKEDIITGYNNIIELTQEDIDPQDLMLSSDVLITDYSSAYIDYLLLDRPVVFYNYDLNDYLKTDRNMYFDYYSVTPGPVTKNFEELYIELHNIIVNNRDDYQELRFKIRKIFYDNKSMQKVSPIVYQLIQEGRFE